MLKLEIIGQILICSHLKVIVPIHIYVTRFSYETQTTYPHTTSTQPLHLHRLPCTKATPKYMPDQPLPNKNFTNPIYAIKTPLKPSRGSKKELTSALTNHYFLQ